MANTGTADAKGRTVYRGPRGGHYVRSGANGANKKYRKSRGHILTLEGLLRGLKPRSSMRRRRMY